MAKRANGSEGAIGGLPTAPKKHGPVIAEFDVPTAHCFLVALDEETPDGALGQVRIGDVCYQVVERQIAVVSPDPDRDPDPACVDGIDPTELLTARELQIVRLVCFGQVNKQIAHRLRISEYTVKTYLKQIFMKLNVHSRAAMVFRCARWVGGQESGPHSRQ